MLAKYPLKCQEIWTLFQYLSQVLGFPMLKIRWLWDRLTFNMGIPIQVKWNLYIETAPRDPFHIPHTSCNLSLQLFTKNIVALKRVPLWCWCVIYSSFRSRNMHCQVGIVSDPGPLNPLKYQAKLFALENYSLKAYQLFMRMTSYCCHFYQGWYRHNI